jgi:hypothetical protein
MKGRDLKNLIGDQDFFSPIIFLFVFSMILGVQMRSLPDNFENFDKVHSIILDVPIIFGDSTLETIGNFCWFYLPIAIFFIALREKDFLLKVIYMLGAIPFILTGNVIIKLGYKSLYVFDVAILFVIVMLLIKYLTRTIELYKTELKQRNR